MSVYLAKQNSGAALPAFAERGLSDRMPGEVSEVIIHAFYEGPANPHFVFSVQNLVDHIYMQQTSQIDIAHGNFKNVFKMHIPSAHMEVPTATLFFDGMTDDTVTQLTSYGLVQDVTRKNAFSGIVRFENMSDIAKLGPVDGRFVPGQITFDGVLAYMYAIKGMDLFSFVSRSADRRTMNIIANVSSKGIVEGDGVDEADFESFLDHGVGRETVSVKQFKEFNELMALDFHELVNANDTSKKIPSSFFAPSQVQYNEQGSGLVFPYFSGMLLKDSRYAFGVFARLFTKGLSDSPSGAMSLLKKIRSGMLSLAFTAAGRAISHAYLGIHLAIESQSHILFLVEKGRYHGFSLQNPNMRILFRGELLLPESGAELTKQCRKISPFQDVVKDIIRLIEETKGTDGEVLYPVSEDDFKSSRAFVTWYSQISIENFPETFGYSLSSLMGKLYYTDKFQIPTQDMIIDFLNYVTTGSESYISKYPAYIGNSYYEATDRIHVGLGIFGDRAPSLNYGSKKDMPFSMPIDLGAQDPLLFKDGDKPRPLHYLPFAIVPIRNAADQWEQLFKSGIIHLPAGRKGKSEFTDSRKVNIKIGSEPYFSQVYKLVKEKSSIVRKGLQTGKRKRGNDDSEEGPKASRKKTRAENEAMAMDI